MADCADLFELKAQARRLRDALQGMQLTVSHSQALGLIGRVHARRDWKELVGRLDSSAPRDTSAMLGLLEMQLRCNGFLEQDLDELVHEHLPRERVSSVNDQGLLAQLQALFQALGSPDRLLQALRETLETFRFESCAIYARAYGPDGLASAEFDALPWLMQAEPAHVAALIRTSRDRFSLGNCDMGDSVVAWSREHGRTQGRNDRSALADLMTAIELYQKSHPEAVGVTLSLSVSDFAAFVEVALEKDPTRYADVTLAWDAAR